jgi:MFS family permease
MLQRWVLGDARSRDRRAEDRGTSGRRWAGATGWQQECDLVSERKGGWLGAFRHDLEELDPRATFRHSLYEFDARITGHHRPHEDASRRRLGYPLLAVLLVTVLAGANLPSPLYATYQSRYHFGAGMVTGIFAAYSIGVLVALLCLGRLSDHFGRRPVLVLGVLLDAVSACLFLLADGVGILLAARVVSGLAMGIVIGAATAGLAELEPHHDLGRAALLSAVASLFGFGLGPVIAGLFTEFGPDPTRLVFGVYLVVLASVALVLIVVPETVTSPDRHPDLRPILYVPRSIRGPFLSVALPIFSAFAVLGVYAGLVAYLIAHRLHDANHAVAGAVVFALFATAALAELAGHRLSRRNLPLVGQLLLAIALVLVLLAVATTSLGVLILGTVVGGTATGFTYMASLATVNRIAPPEHRAGVISSLYVSAYLGFSLPVLAIGIGTENVGVLTATGVAVAVLIAVIACALVLSLVHTPWVARPTVTSTVPRAVDA